MINGDVFSYVMEKYKISFKEALEKEKINKKKTINKGLKAIQSKVEKSTLGDIDALVELKDKLKK